MLKEIHWKQLQMNPMELIANEWMLITAGNQERGYNTMTASWGHLGSLWGHGGGMPTAIAYIRPQRYTKEFVDSEDTYTLSFFAPEYKKALGYLGSHSGRDGDKVAHVGLTPVFDGQTTYFAEAKLVLVCKKLYRGTILESGFLDPALAEEFYPDKDYHDFYIGQILKVLVSED